MVTVYVWSAAWSGYLPFMGEGSPGHAAIKFDNTYVSFWPGKSTGALSWKGYTLKTLAEDKKNYEDKGQKLWTQTLPGKPKGLNTDLMYTHWCKILTSKPNYSATFQCAAVVNDLLIAGGSKGFLTNSITNWSTWYIGAVSPDDVKDYVKALAKAMKA